MQKGQTGIAEITSKEHDMNKYSNYQDKPLKLGDKVAFTHWEWKKNEFGVPEEKSWTNLGTVVSMNDQFVTISEERERIVNKPVIHVVCETTNGDRVYGSKLYETLEPCVETGLSHIPVSWKDVDTYISDGRLVVLSRLQ